MKVKVLTVKQPWAYLICSGIKDIENRTWKTNFRGRIYIHSSAKGIEFSNPNEVFTKEQYSSLDNEHKIMVIMSKKAMECSSIIGSVEIVDCVLNHPSVWAEKGVYHWVLANPILFEKPIVDVKGKLGLWNYAWEETNTSKAIVSMSTDIAEAIIPRLSMSNTSK